MSDAVKRETRLRVWIGIFYPESTKPNWKQILEDNFICCAVSPLHDRDVYEDDEDGHKAGEFKKPHHHIVFRFSGSKSYTQVYDILKLISLNDSCPPPKIPHGDVNRCVQYLIHYNDKSKFQYLRSLITSINGFDVDRCFVLNTEQEAELFDALFSYIETNNIFEYWDLLKSLRSSAETCNDSFCDEMLRFSRTHTILLSTMLKSRYFSYLNNGGEK